ncbi:MAG: phosphonopyruvate decarboxylase [Candidatus Micrarchaeota archaeon]
MVDASEFTRLLLEKGIRFYSGVPETIMKHWISSVSKEKNAIHVPATHEGEAVSLCAGYHLATGEVAAVYMQNSGLGNAVDPLTSLVNREVYSIPLLLLIGLRGEQGTRDEPQHHRMGKSTGSLLESIGIEYVVLDEKVEELVDAAIAHAKEHQSPYALIIRKGFFSGNSPGNGRAEGISREEAINIILERIGEVGIVVSTTGVTSRELFELREKRKEGHDRDFYNLGAMGHCIAIGAGIALGKHPGKVTVLDGDGSVLMHAGNLATIGHNCLNIVHVVFDNNCYESTGKQPTVSGSVDFRMLAQSLGYKKTFLAKSIDELDGALDNAFGSDGPAMIVVKTRSCSREDLGRPTKTPMENKRALMKWLNDY